MLLQENFQPPRLFLMASETKLYGLGIAADSPLVKSLQFPHLLCIHAYHILILDQRLDFGILGVTIWAKV